VLEASNYPRNVSAELRRIRQEYQVRSIAKRTIAIGAIGLAILNLAGCGEEIDARQTKEIQGLLYKIHDKDPFSGRVTNYPMSVLGLFNVGTCTVDIKKGLPDGDMTCSDTSGKVVGTGEFKAGKQDGKVERFDANTGKKTVVEHWSQGRKDGVQEQYDPQSGEKVLEVNYSQGRKDGRERAWDSTGKEKIADLEWAHGVQTGFDNRGTQHSNYVNGKKQGVQQDYSIANNHWYLANENNYENDVMHGVQKQMDAQGNVTELSVFDHGRIRSRTVDKYNYSGQHVHHYSGLAIIPDASQYMASDLSKDGVEQYWDDQGHLIRELQWRKGILQSAVATVWSRDKQDSQYQGIGVSTTLPTQSVVKQGQERVLGDNGELQAVIFWNNGRPVQILASLAPALRAQHPGKMALVDDDEYGTGVTSVPDFEQPSRFSTQGVRGENLQFVDVPSPTQASAVGEVLPASAPVVAIPGVSANSDSCVDQRVEAVHAENPDALIPADMLEEFEQDCK
jgi:antitoxin component YwqK of YwqJK toxin-antitoxin module